MPVKALRAHEGRKGNGSDPTESQPLRDDAAPTVSDSGRDEVRSLRIRNAFHPQMRIGSGTNPRPPLYGQQVDPGGGIRVTGRVRYR